MIAIAHDAGLDVGGVRGGHIFLRHAEAGANLAFEQRLEPTLLLRRRAVARQDFHVSGIGRGTIKHLRGHWRTSHNFAERRVFKIRQARAVLAIRQKEIPQARGARFRFKLLDDRHGPPTVFRDLLVIRALVGIDVIIHERGELFLETLHLIGIVEVHSVVHLIACAGPAVPT